MDRNTFVKCVRRKAFESSVNNVIANLEDPPGRKPSAGLVELSKWYKSLSDSDRSNLRRVARMASDYAVFGFLCLIDGARSLSPGNETADLRLYLEKDGNSVLLNDPNEEELHELFRQERDDDV